MDREKVLNEYFRILKPGGSIALVENLPFNPFINLYRLNRRMSAATEPQREYVNSIKGIYRFPILIDLERISLPWSGGIIICSAWLLSFWRVREDMHLQDHWISSSQRQMSWYLN
jgi:hypothetical protein